MNEKSIKYLREKVFKTDEYYQFELLFRQAREIEKKERGPLGILERAYIYNGKSVLSCVFSKIEVTPIDYRPISAKTRQGFQESWIEQAGLNCLQAKDSVIDSGRTFDFNIKNKKSKSLFIPNVLHHCRDFNSMIVGLKKQLPHLRTIYIFDSYIRENHQDPDDFCRYTPSALSVLLKKVGFIEKKRSEVGNIFDAILYLISQAKECLKNSENIDLQNKLRKVIPLLKEKRKSRKYRSLGRKFASAATGYALTFERM